MESYKIGSKINLNGKEFEIIDMWFGEKVFSDTDNTHISNIFYANLRDEHGHVLGPVGINRVILEK
jgi:hypothetical protein